MKYFSDFEIVVPHGATGEVKTLCPRCSATRKKPNDKCLNVNIEKGTWNCKNCPWTGGLAEIKRSDFVSQKAYKKPEPPKTQVMGKDWGEWLLKRGIAQDVWARNKLFSASCFMPQTSKSESCLNFPFYKNGELVNIKHRDIEKHFCQEKDAEQPLYGYDDIENDCLVWVEGEIDKLSLEVAGIKSCVSVPAGAPGPNDKNISKKFEFFESAKERLDLVKKHIIAVDKDGPGFRLQEELIRRLGAENCHVVVWPDGCKDANDCLQQFGPQGVSSQIENAKPCPIKGIISMSDIADGIFSAYESGVIGGVSTGWPSVDECYTVRPGEWTVITGIPGHGKSEWLDALVLNLAHSHGWKFGIFSPENQPLVEHAKKLLEKVVNKPFGQGATERMSIDELVSGTGWLDGKFHFVVPEEPTIDEIISLGKKMVRRFGINGMIVDPWNELDHSRPSAMTETEYISHAISKFRRFARENQIHLWLVAHPYKMKRDEKTGKYIVPSLYDISGSAHWRNKADNGICVYRHLDEPERMVDVYIQKIRFKAVGKVGKVSLAYDRVTGRYRDPVTNFTRSFIGGNE